MAKAIACPKCKQPIVVSSQSINGDGRLACQSCGASFKVQKRPSEGQPAKPNTDPIPPPDPVPPSEDSWTEDSSDPYSSYDDFDEGSYDSYEPLSPMPPRGKSRKPQQPNASPPVQKSAKQSGSTQKASAPAEPTGRKYLVPLIIAGSLALMVLLVGIGVVVYRSTMSSTSVAANDGATKPAENNGEALADNAGVNGVAMNNIQIDDPRTDGLMLGMLARPGKPITITESIPGIERAPMDEYYVKQEEAKMKFLKHERVEPAAVANKSFAELTASLKSSTDPGNVQAPRWTLEPDPLPPELDYELSENLKIVNELWDTASERFTGYPSLPQNSKPSEWFPPLKTYETSNYALSTKTYFADQNGPFAVLTPRIDKSPWGWKVFTKYPKITKYELIERPCENLQVTDLRTGKSAGEFSWEAPFWRPLILSPDGQTLIGPSNDIEVTENILREVPHTEKEAKELAKQQASLFSWSQGKKTKPQQMPMSGEVKAVKFANNVEMVVLVESPKRQLEVWDTSTGKQSKVIELDSKLTYLPNFSAGRYQKYDPLNLTMNPPIDHKALAISGGGKYASVLSESGAILVSLTDSKVVGTLPLPGCTTVPYVYSGRLQYVEATLADTEFDGKLESCVGFEFLPTGDKLAIAFNRDGLLRLMIYDITSGELSLEKTWSNLDTSKSVAKVHPNGQGLILTGGATQMLDFNKPTSEVDESLPNIFKFNPRGPFLTLAGDGDFKTVFTTIPRNDFDEKINAKLSRNFQNLPKRHAAQVVDRSKLEIVDPTPPATFQAVANWTFPPPPPGTSIQSEMSPLAFGGNKALIVNSRRTKQNFDAFDARFVDLSKPGVGETSEPFEILSYNFTEGSGLDRPPVGAYYFPGAMNSKDDRFAFGDPDKHGRAEIWSVDPPQRLMTFESSQKPGGYFSWMDFDSEGNLLTLEQGVICSWKIADEGITSLFALAGDYCRPIRFSPDRKILLASRGETFDLIDAATGKCLNRLTFNNKDWVAEAIFGPSGHHLAVHFGIHVPYGQEFGKELGEKQTPSHSVIWDLATGEALVSKFPVVIDGWFGPEHVLLRYVNGSIRGAGLFDLKYNRETVAYHHGAGARLADRRLWHWFDNTKQFRLSSFSGTPAKDEAPYIDPQRTIFDIQKNPVSLEVVAGTPELAKKFAPELVANMQKIGWKIGPSKFVIKVSPMAYASDKRIEFTTGQVVDIPYVHYLWRLFDDKGQVISEAASRGDFDQQTSKYMLNKDQLDLETRRVTGDTALGFGLKDPTTAMIDEILESGRGLTYCPIPIEPQFLSDGKIYKIPTELPVSQSP